MLNIDFQDRIERACQAIDDGAMLVLSQPEAIRNSDVHHAYRQESFFHYLTGFDEPQAALLLLGHKPKGQRALLFLREKDAFSELWTGRRLGVASAVKTLAVDQSYPISELWLKFPEAIKGVSRLYYRFGVDVAADQFLIQALFEEKRKRGRNAKNSLLPVYDAFAVSGELRLVKTAAEIERMRRAASISTQAYTKVFASVRPGMNERDVHAMLIEQFMSNGGEMQAYNSIVASGINACCLHYTENNSKLKDGDLLLIDAGAQFEYYASDVTRTFPIGKRFSSEQKAFYEIVLDAQLKAIDAAKPGVSLVQIHDVVLRALCEGLLEQKLLAGSVDEAIETESFKDFYPHGTSHWLGLDVHDIGDYAQDGKPTMLAQGMCFTIEPGLYVDPDNQKVPARFRGLGIRIEDDILVTHQGCDVLTKDIPKSVKDMENRY